MHYGKIATIGIVALALASDACNNNVADSRNTAAREESPRDTGRAAELQQKRNDDISHLDKRVVDIEHEYAEAIKSSQAAKGLQQPGYKKS